MLPSRCRQSSQYLIAMLVIMVILPTSFLDLLGHIAELFLQLLAWSSVDDFWGAFECWLDGIGEVMIQAQARWQDVNLRLCSGLEGGGVEAQGCNVWRMVVFHRIGGIRARVLLSAVCCSCARDRAGGVFLRDVAILQCCSWEGALPMADVRSDCFGDL